jgi:mono/diheme cytochrome c family protein
MTHRTIAAVLALASALILSNSLEAETSRPLAEALPVPLAATREQVLQGDRIFHGEAANGKCFECHGADAKGTPTGNDLTLGMWIWGDGSLSAIKKTLAHNMKMAPKMDGDLAPADVDAVAAYVWAIGHQRK